ncbi:acyltransferase family protein [Mammaliicoccus lentus]|uniref:acyltransferase family protein n=1 Tax=Mammaliicoccus TaxID=2803850 RepID=UPI000CD2C368|nr:MULTISPECIES: acyltransferase family protein [Mammaliicoccus]POA04036.1 acyltransferase [Mammaliicoccus lentus]SUM52399.1 putative acyltransferase [Mammaliicoccus lentus]HBV02916.1 acyltransferase [Staphylococcus sp.]
MDKNIIDIERKFRPEIEGLRIVAALLVAIYHIWFGKVSGGVDVFFVVSGFLITTSIISTINKTGEFKFWPYISKLMKRLFPLAFIIILVVLILSIFFLPSTIFDKTIKETFSSMFYYQNWQLAISNTDYLDANQMKSPFEHYWAMSIQGQFYIIWFILFSGILLLIKKYGLSNGKRLVNVVLGFLFIVSFIYSVYLTAINQPLAYFITFTRVWEFALGGLLCINLSSIKISNIAAEIIGWIGLIGLILTGALFDVSTMFPGYIALWPMTCALLIILSGNKETKYGVKNFLSMPIMIKLGGVSFGIYLWHWVLLSFYKYNISENPGIVAGLLIILLSIALSFVTTKYIETPIRNAKFNKLAFKRIGYIALVNILLITGLVSHNQYVKIQDKKAVANKDYPGALSINLDKDKIKENKPKPEFANVFDDLPQSHLDNSNQSMSKSEVKVGKYGKQKDYKATIALVGSSHSEHWLGAVIKAAEENDYRVINITRSGTRFSTGYKKNTLQDDWVKNVENYLEKADDIDLVLSHVTASDTESEKIQQQMVDQLLKVKNNYGIEVMAIRDIPRYDFNVSEELEKHGEKDTIERMNKGNRQLDEAFWEQISNEEKDLPQFDPSEYFKVNGKYRPIIGNIVVYRDMDHMTNTYSETFGPILGDEIKKVVKK